MSTIDLYGKPGIKTSDPEFILSTNESGQEYGLHGIRNYNEIIRWMYGQAWPDRSRDDVLERLTHLPDRHVVKIACEVRPYIADLSGTDIKIYKGGCFFISYGFGVISVDAQGPGQYW